MSRYSKLNARMDEYPFNLRGYSRSFGGPGGNYNGSDSVLTGIHNPKEFALKPGLLIVKFEHGGIGTCRMQFILDPKQFKNVVSMIYNLKMRGNVHASFVDYEDDSPMWCVIRVSGRKSDHESDKGEIKTFLEPREYFIQVESTSWWSCQFIQPDLGQSKGRFPHRFKLGGEWVPPITEPFRTGSRQVHTNIWQTGTGEYAVCFRSLDGAHAYDATFTGTGKRVLNPDLKPNTEYLMYVMGNGAWDVELVEGY